MRFSRRLHSVFQSWPDIYVWNTTRKDAELALGFSYVDITVFLPFSTSHLNNQRPTTQTWRHWSQSILPSQHLHHFPVKTHLSSKHPPLIKKKQKQNNSSQAWNEVKKCNNSQVYALVNILFFSFIPSLFTALEVIITPKKQK